MKKILIIISILVTILISPINSYAKEIECNYTFKDNNLKYIIDNNNVQLAFNDSEKANWYHSASFEDSFLKSAKTSAGRLVCPTLVVEENELFTTIFVNAIDKNNCNGVCTSLNVNSSNVNVLNSYMGNAVGIYMKDSYFMPVFRKLSDGTFEYSIDNKNFYNIKNSIKLDKNSVVKIDASLKDISESKLSNIYRCFYIEDGVMTYYLAKNSKFCPKDMSENDNQGNGSLSYNGAKGDPEGTGTYTCQETLLGSVDQPDSVAWLLQKLLDYMKILGPMIVLVMSGIEFAKAIINSDDETMQKSYKRLITRLVLVVILFFVPDLVSAILQLFGIMGDPICGLK